MKICKLCRHKIENHYLKPNGKPIRFWGKDKFGNKKLYCSCRECEEWDAIHAGATQ